MSAAPNTDDALIDHALYYAAHDFEVFPVSPVNKAPLVDNGFKDATTDPATIRRWWTDNPDALIGCRVPADLLILDIDPRHGGDKTWAELLNCYPDTIPAGREHHSGRGDGGRHIWFKRPDGIQPTAKPLHEWARKAGTGHATGKRGWSSGIDILHHDQRYTILPPSPHPETRLPYTWLRKKDPVVMPGWLVDLITKAPQQAQPPRPTLRVADETSIADWFSANSNWNDILGPNGAGWELVAGDGDSDGSKWRHPAATAESSCSIRHGCLFVYTPNTDFEQTEEGDTHGYTRFRAWAVVEHDSDLKAAARAALELRDGPNTTTSRSKGFTPVDDYKAAEPDDPWGEILPLTANIVPPSFPLDVLPGWLRNYAEAKADTIQVSTDMTAVLGLGALSVATIGRLKVRYHYEDWTQPCGLYIALVAPPSAGKSPAKAAMFGPLEQYEQERMATAAGERRAHTELIDVERNKIISHKKSMSSDPNSVSLQEELRDMVLRMVDLEAKMPASGRLMADDATIEALGIVLSEAGGAVGVVSAEGGLFDRLAGLYNENGMNLDLYLEGWSGGRYKVDRVKRDSLLIPQATLAVITTIQPHTLDAIGAKEAFAGRGLTARFLLSFPPSNVGQRRRGRKAADHRAIENTYADQLVTLAVRHAGDTIVVELDDDACERFAEWDQATEYRVAPGADLAHISDWVGKLRGNVLRIAALLHVGWGKRGDVDLEDTERAIRVADYFLAHMAAITERWALDEGVAKARAVIDWITRNGHEEFSVRDLYLGNRRLFPSPEDTIQPLRVLVETLHLRPLFDGPITVGRGGRPSPRFAVHPDLCAQCAQCAPPLGVGAERSVANRGGNEPKSSSFPETPPPPDPVHTEHTGLTGRETQSEPKVETDPPATTLSDVPDDEIF